MDMEGIRRLIVIPQTQYQQLIQNQTKAATVSPPKYKGDDDGKSGQNQCYNNDSQVGWLVLGLTAL